MKQQKLVEIVVPVDRLFDYLIITFKVLNEIERWQDKMIVLVKEEIKSGGRRWQDPKTV